MPLYKTFFVEEYEKNIPLFLVNHKMGSIHSVFTNGMNIRMGERLFFIGTTKNGRLPFGIHLMGEQVHELLTTVPTSSSIFWKEETKELYIEEANAYIHFNNGSPYTNTIRKLPQEMSDLNIENIITLLVHENTGLDINIGDFLLHYLTKSEKKCRIGKEIERLMSAIHSDDVSEIEHVVRYFLGRGKGLTPSGDDHLIGILAIHSLTDSFSLPFIQTLEKIVKHESITTDIGREYLLYALKGEFSSSVTNIINNLDKNEQQEYLMEHLQRLITMGHSSGVDTLFGMLIGLLSLRKHQSLNKHDHSIIT